MKNIRSSIYGVIDALILPLLMLIATPLFLNYLGVEGYATWILINSIIASLAIFNFGGVNVVIKFISAGRGGNDKNTAEEVFSTVFAFQSIAVLLIYALFLVTVPFVIQYFSSENFLIFLDILYVAIPVFFLKQSEQLLYAFLRGYEQFGHMTILSTASKVLFILVQIITAVYTQSVLDVFYGALIVSVLIFIFQFVYLKAMHKDNISFSKVNVKTAKSLLNFGGWSWLSSLTSMIKADSDKWLVSGLLGLKTFGFYSIGILIFNQLYIVVGSSISWIFPNISKDNLDKRALAKKYWKLLFFVSAISLIISITLSNLSFLFELWLGEEFYQDSQYYINTFLLLFPIFTMVTVPHFYLLGLGQVKQKSYADIISLIVKVVTIWLVINTFNIHEWVLFFIVFISVEYIAYSKIISKEMPIKFTHLVIVLLCQMLVILARIQ